VPENLKNILLFMSSSGYLVPPSRDPEKAELWNETWKRIDRFLPELRGELALEEEQQQQVKKGEEKSELPVVEGQAQGVVEAAKLEEGKA
jgi:brefeldin A-resistance guanine nucleotide exchange factor 1